MVVTKTGLYKPARELANAHATCTVEEKKRTEKVMPLDVETEKPICGLGVPFTISHCYTC